MAGCSVAIFLRLAPGSDRTDCRAAAYSKKCDEPRDGEIAADTLVHAQHNLDVVISDGTANGRDPAGDVLCSPKHWYELELILWETRQLVPMIIPSVVESTELKSRSVERSAPRYFPRLQKLPELVWRAAPGKPGLL